jgi:hypothetical protein
MHTHTQTIWLRSADILARYRWRHARSIQRAVADGRLPAPKFPLGPRTPLWSIADIEANEVAQIEKNAAAPPPRPAPHATAAMLAARDVKRSRGGRP